MKNFIYTIFIFTMMSLIGCGKSDEGQVNETKQLFYADDFETGDYSMTEGGFEWDGDTEISETPNGTLGIKFKYGPDGLREDTWREQRYFLGDNYNDIWIKYDLYIPENYHHRCDLALKLDRSASDFELGDVVAKVETTDDSPVVSDEKWGIVKHIVEDTIYVDELPDLGTLRATHTIQNKRTGSNYKVVEKIGNGVNNKLGVIWQGKYGSDKTGNAIEFGLWYGYRGNSNLSYAPSKDHGAWVSGHTTPETPFIDKEKDLGKWMEVIIHVKVASKSNNDGVVQVWKNGEKYFDATNVKNYSDMGYNYYDKGYLLGYSNSGFEEETNLYIDNVVFSTETISPK